MFYKYIIFDLDDTLYNYEYCHEIAITEVFIYINKYYNINIDSLKKVYNNINKNLKNVLGNIASSHNRFIYFKHMIEKFKLNYSIIEIINNKYWDIFFDNIKSFDGIEEFIKWNYERNIKMAILTDFQTEYQIKKLSKLNLLQFIDIIITSEEIGFEKPNVNGFLKILNHFNCSNNDIIMIGDNYEKDIIGAINIDIYSLHFYNKENTSSRKFIKNNKYDIFNNYSDLLNKYDNIYKELTHFENICKYCGERYDLTQAGGGNISFKCDNLMFIKSSGKLLSNISISENYVIIDNYCLLNDITKNTIENNDKHNIFDYNILGNKKNRASIETYMHSILKKYTIHLHPIQLNKILILEESKTIITNLFPEALIIDYYTPGIKLCNEIYKNYNNENVIFLLNHGIIITSDNYSEIYNILENTLIKCELFLKLNMDKYKYVNTISKEINAINNTNLISYLSCDNNIIHYLNNNIQLFKENMTFPDVSVYCGEILIYKEFNDISIYYEKHNILPKIILYNTDIYIISKTLEKCLHIEQVLKANLLLLDSEYKKNYLSDNEIYFLNNWDAEKYRIEDIRYKI